MKMSRTDYADLLISTQRHRKHLLHRPNSPNRPIGLERQASGHVPQQYEGSHMYRVGSGKFIVGTLIPLNTIVLARSEKTLGVLRFIVWTFQGLMGLWLLGVVGLAIAAIFLRRDVNLRAPRVDSVSTVRTTLGNRLE
jgi:hypothetical protein